MQPANPPVRFSEAYNLASLGLSAELFKPGNLTFESEKYIGIKDGAEIVIVDIGQGFKVERKPMKAEATVLHPD